MKLDNCTFDIQPTERKQRNNPNKRLKKVKYKGNFDTIDELQEKIKEQEAEFEIKKDEKEGIFIRDQRLYQKVTYKKKTKEEAINEIQKWKKDTINKTVEKEALRVSKVMDPQFCIFID